MLLDAVCSGQPGLTHVLYEVRGRLRATAQLQPELTLLHVPQGSPEQAEAISFAAAKLRETLGA
jgi:hypothetical protein